jgi:hypothetical protein
MSAQPTLALLYLAVFISLRTEFLHQLPKDDFAHMLTRRPNIHEEPFPFSRDRPEQCVF